MNNRGSVAAMVSLTLLPLMLFVGLAFDTAQLWLLRQRLQWAVDSGGLLGASQLRAGISNAQVQSDATALFWANFGAPSTLLTGASHTGFLGATAATPTVTISTNTVTLRATATAKTLFMQLVPGVTAGTVSASSISMVPGVEIALALDNSLSMNLQLPDGTMKLNALVAAAKGMVTTLFGASATAPSNLYMSIVPFAGAVNVGASNVAFLDQVAYANDFPTGIKKNGKASKKAISTDAAWRGCVAARPAPDDLSEVNPSTVAFPPYYYNTTLQNNGVGDNDYDDTALPGEPNVITDTSSASETSNTNLFSYPRQVGPNLFCPHTSLLALTNSSTALNAELSKLTPVNGGGTILTQGLQWGWLTISPLWASSAPSSSGWGLGTVNSQNRPLPYGNTTNTKVIVLMTDGMNEIDGADSWYGWADSQNQNPLNCANQTNVPTPAQAPREECSGSGGNSWYTSYGRVSAGALGELSSSSGNNFTDSTNLRAIAVNNLNTKFLTLCNNVKADGIIIFTIFFHSRQDDYLPGTDTALANKNLQQCATDVNHYFNSTDTASINAAFAKIAQQIAALRLQY